MIEDIRYLIIFAKIAEFGSISKGAKALGLSTTTVSMHLAKLEKNLECALFYRNTRKMTLTHDGQKLLDTAKLILETYESGLSDFKQRSIIRKTQLHISIPAVFIHSDLMQSITKFCEAYQGLTVHLTCDDSRTDLIAENVDIAIRIGELPDSSFKARYLFPLARSIVATPDFLKQQQLITHPKDLINMKWIGLSMRKNKRILRHQHTGEEVEISYQPHIYVNNVEAAYQLAKLNVGLAAPPDELIQADLAQQNIVKVLPNWTLEPLSVYAVWPANIPVNSIAHALIERLYQSFNSKIV
ncbi:LysR family transcriptional regulator [Acinetobacter proteolyticus]|uniref:Transcriptional regulator n=1 Tax=Acinetobacter proteolyticus TaxID=1776741 RepID=A0A2N0WGJ9_9GAMM|nr:LysR family transcriptional regulator [Acinetobacter proteolyticus]MBK5648632.1 LysR family transcriptional regulator [Acinetobacter sp.]PKF34322.1 transcriptional regulator [Acinetobacter proteolyticus]